MFALVVLPLVDMRPFYYPEIQRRFPSAARSKSGESPFLRGFGSVRKRNKSGSLVWPDEEFYFRSRGFIRFEPSIMFNTLSVGISISYVQARFYFDGYSTGRLEVILRIRRRPTGRKKDPKALRLVAELATLRVRCQTLDGWSEVNLADAGGHLAAHFERSTAAPSAESPIDAVASGRPLMLLLPSGATFDEKKSDLYPDGLRLGDYHRVGPSLDAVFLNEKVQGLKRGFPGNTLAILVDRGLRTSAPEDSHELLKFRRSLEDERRATRMFMTRYHVEREGLRLVADAFADNGETGGLLQDEATRSLEIYLSRRLRHLKKPDRIAGVPSSRDAVRVAYARAIEVCSEMKLPTLLSRVSQLQRTLGSSLERYLSQDLAVTGRRIVRDAEGKVVIKLTDSRKIIMLGAGVTVEGSVVAADSIQSSFNSVRHVRNRELAQHLEDLHQAVAHLTTVLDTDEAELAAANLQELVDEAGKQSPRLPFVRRAAESLANLAKRGAEVGLPVIELIEKIRALLTPG